MKLNSLGKNNVISGWKSKVITAMICLSLYGCMSDGDDMSLAELFERNRIAMDSTQILLDELSKSMDSLNVHLDQFAKRLQTEDSIKKIDQNKKVSDMRFPVFHEPKIETVMCEDCIENGATLLLSDFVKKLQKKSEQGKTFVLEGSPEGILFKDSLMLYSVFNKENSAGKKVRSNMDKNDYKSAEFPVAIEKQNELYRWFLRYVEGRINGKKQERKSDVRDAFIKKDTIGDITLYYTDIDKKKPGILAKHPSIQPINYNCIWADINPYHTADYYSLSYTQPKQKIINIPKEIFDVYGIYNEEDVAYVLETINSGKEFSENNLSANKNIAPDTLSTTQQDTLVQNTDSLAYTQWYTIKKNGQNILQIQDYGRPDNDQVKINSKEYVISKKNIDVDLSKIIGNKVIVEIMNEGTEPPNTLLLTLGAYKKKLEGKKGEIIVLEFEE